VSHRRFCDRCDAQVEDTGVPHVDFLAESDEQQGGTITEDWDLCAKCASLFNLFMGGAKLQGEGQER
jgi:hypothetical protein